MQIINDNNLRILIPDKGFLLVNKESGVVSQKIYLGKFDDESNYTEMADPDYVHEDDSVNLILMTVDGLITALNPVIASMPFTLEAENDNTDLFIQRIVMFYEEMISRGLKEKEDVLEPYRSFLK